LKVREVISRKDIEETPGYPSKSRINRGAVAVIECPEEIPCNVCEGACPREAIKVGHPITNLPILDEDKCTGCGLCIAQCPGLAIFVIDMKFSDQEAMVSFPYEHLPVPKVGSIIDAVDRNGNILTESKVVRVHKEKYYDHTLIISVAVPKAFAQDIRGILWRRKINDQQ